MELIQIQAHVIKTADKNNWKIQPNQKRLTSIMERMQKKVSGNTVLCPCKAYVEGFMTIASVSCPCPEAAQDIENQGMCHCNLFYAGDTNNATN
jgi:ferredoxin-thioredoxin reductase catalytic chain